MPSGKDAQYGRHGLRKLQQHCTPERVNTARADEEQCNIALMQVNALNESPASEVKSPSTDSPTIQKLQHEVHELSEDLAADQPQLPFLQRPTSAGLLPKGECFKFQTRQSREINLRRERKPSIQQDCSLSQPGQRCPTTENANEQPCVALVGEDTSPSFLGPFNFVVADPRESATTIRTDLTRAPLSTTLQTIQPSSATKDADPTHSRVCDDISGNVVHEPHSENILKSAVKESAVYHAETLTKKAQYYTPLDAMPIGSGQYVQGQNYSQDVHHSLHLTKNLRLAPESFHHLEKDQESEFLPMATKETYATEKETQDCSAQADGPHITPGASQDVPADSSSTLEQCTLPQAELTELTEVLRSTPKQGENEYGPAEESRGSHLLHTPQANAKRFAEKPARVCKVLSNPQPVPQPLAPSIQGDANPPDDTAISRGPVTAFRETAPSEEDLFYLLMHRQRQRKDIETKLLVKQKHLMTMNRRLSQENQNYQRQLKALCSGRDKSAADASTQKAALEDFKTRFHKLKTFVNGLGNDYIALRQEADEMKIRQHGLCNEKEDIYQDLQNCHITLAASTRSIGGVVLDVAKVRQSILPLEKSLSEAKALLGSERHLLSKEQQKNKKLETYLLRVATAQNKHSSAIQGGQKTILNQLKDIAVKVDAIEKVEPQPLHLPGLDDCVKMLTTIHDTHRVGPVELNKVTDALGILSESLLSYHKSSVEGSQAVADAQINFDNQLVAQITALLEPLRSSTVQEGHLADLREDKIRLEEQLKSSDNVIHEIRECRTSAEAREGHLRNTTDSLLNQVKILQSKSIPIHRPPSQLDEREMIGTWQLKYTNISQELKASEERVNKKDFEIQRSVEEVRKLAEKLKVAETKRNELVQALSEASGLCLAQKGDVDELQRKLADRESVLKLLHLKLYSAKAKIRQQAEGLGELAGLRTQHQNELADISSQLKDATRESAKARQQVQELENSLTGMAQVQEEASKAVQLTEELHKERAKVTKLGQEIKPLEEVARQVSELKQQLAGKQKVMESLEAQLKEAEAISKQVEDMEAYVSKLAEEMSEVQSELRTAQKTSNWLVEQNKELCTTTQEVEDLREKLVDLQALAEQVPELQKELDNAKELVEQLPDLQLTNKGTNEEVALLQEEVQAAEAALSRLQRVEDESDKKDHELKDLKERLRATEENLGHFQCLHEVVNQKEEVIATLNQEIDTAKDVLKQLKVVQDANDHKDEEIASLKERLKAAESILNNGQTVKEESQQKKTELSALKDRLANIEEESPQFSQTLAKRPSQDQNPSQETMAAFLAMMTKEDRDLQTGRAVIVPPVSDTASHLKGKENHNFTFVSPQALQIKMAETGPLASEGVRESSSDKAFETSNTSNLVQFTESEILRIQETTFVPESQPDLALRYEESPVRATSFISVSSPLTDHDHFPDLSYDDHHGSAYFGFKKASNESSAIFADVPANSNSSHQLPFALGNDLPSSRPPSSSTGDTMLLETEEQLKKSRQHHDSLFRENSRQRLSPRYEASSPKGPPAKKSEGLFGNRADKSSSKTAKAKSKVNDGRTPKHPSPRRLRSESQTGIKKTMPLQERGHSDQNMPASPQVGMLREKYLPNSAAKRRIEDDEISVISSSQDSSKRLKRNLSALEIKAPSNKKKSSLLEQVTSVTGSSRLNHPSMPTGGRKGSIIGTNAPAPRGGGHTSKKTRKSSNTERYSARFNQDTT